MAIISLVEILCGVISLIHEQSKDISQGVIRGLEEEQGAGDQGMMFGYGH